MTQTKRPVRTFPWIFAALAAALLVAGFATAFYSAFPRRALEQRLSYELARRTPYRLTLKGAALRPVSCLAVDTLTLDNPPAPLTVPPLRKIRVTPRWLALFSGHPGLDFSASVPPGSITGSWYRDGRLSLDVRQLPLTPWCSEFLGLRLAGTLDQGNLQARLAAPPQPPQSSQLRIEGTKLSVAGWQKYGLSQDLIRLGNAHIATESNNGRLDIKQLTFRGGDLEVDITGSVLLAVPASRSRLNLQLSLRPTAGLDPAAVELLSAVARPAPDGSIRLRLTGPIRQPNLE